MNIWRFMRLAMCAPCCSGYLVYPFQGASALRHYCHQLDECIVQRDVHKGTHTKSEYLDCESQEEQGQSF